MGTYSIFRKSAALCLAACAPATALAFPAAAQAAPSKSDCVELGTLASSFAIVVKDVLDPKDMQLFLNGGKLDEKKLDSAMDRRLDEIDPITGKPRIQLFFEHLGDLDALAHDADGKIADPEGAEAIGKLRDGLDSYLDLIDRLKAGAESGEAADQDGADKDDSDQDSSDKDGFGEEAALAAFDNGIDAFTDYVDRSHCHQA